MTPLCILLIGAAFIGAAIFTTILWAALAISAAHDQDRKE